MIPSIDGDTIHVDSIVIFGWGVDQQIFGQSAAVPPEKTKKTTPIEALWVSGQYNPEDGVYGRIIKEHLQNLAKCINECYSIAIY